MLTNCLSCNIKLRYFSPSLKACFSCNPGFYGDDANVKCSACHASCKTCQGPASTDCLTCRYDSYYKTSTLECIQCNANQYGDDTNQVCANCHETCTTCNAAGETSCLSCTPVV